MSPGITALAGWVVAMIGFAVLTMIERYKKNLRWHRYTYPTDFDRREKWNIFWRGYP